MTDDEVLQKKNKQLVKHKIETSSYRKYQNSYFFPAYLREVKI